MQQEKDSLGAKICHRLLWHLYSADALSPRGEPWAGEEVWTRGLSKQNLLWILLPSMAW